MKIIRKADEQGISTRWNKTMTRIDLLQYRNDVKVTKKTFIKNMERMVEKLASEAEEKGRLIE